MGETWKVLDKGFIELVDHLGNDKIIVEAARISHLSKGKSGDDDAQLVQKLIKNNHTSPLEQVEFQFLVKCPLFVARQWMRHRTWSYNEVSRRYTEAEIEFYYPSVIPLNGVNLDTNNEYVGMMKTHSQLSLSLYKYFVDSGLSLEQARIILPQNMYTTFYAKTDLHNLFHFLELRNTQHAQMEIRVYAEVIEELIKPIVPLTYEAWKNKFLNSRRNKEI